MIILAKLLRKSKKSEVIIGVPDDEHWVEKSRPLLLMKEVPFELGELKILDTYIARINPKNAQATTVRFSKEEYEDLMGIKRMQPERLNKYVTSMQGKVIKVPDKDVRSGWRNYNLFDESSFEQDENGQWWIDLSCTRKAKKLFFNIDGITYLKYQLKNVLPLTSKYSILLYLYLLDNRFRKSWEIPLDKLRFDVLRATDPLYNEFKYINQRILKKCVAEINEKTDIEFSYSTVKTGVRVTGIIWNLIKDEATPPALPEPVPLEELEDDDTVEELAASEDVLLWKDFLPKDLTLYEVETLGTMAYKQVPYDRNSVLPRSNQIADYLAEKHLVLKGYEAKKGRTIKHFAFLKKAVQEDWKP